MSGIKVPTAAEQAEITRIRDRIATEIVTREMSYGAVAHAALLIWVQIVAMDPEFTREHAKSVANSVIDHYIVPRSN